MTYNTLWMNEDEGMNAIGVAELGSSSSRRAAQVGMTWHIYSRDITWKVVPEVLCRVSDGKVCFVCSTFAFCQRIFNNENPAQHLSFLPSTANPSSTHNELSSRAKR